MISTAVFAQFDGGNGDGHAYGEVQNTLNQQNLYCSGGDGAGYSRNSVSQPLNAQNFYFGGGNGDGFASANSPFTSQNNQSFYCGGGDGDGYAKSDVKSPLNMHLLYCSGGSDDGYSSESSGATQPNNQSLYCYGGNGDGFASEKASTTSLFDQSFYCGGGNGDGFAEKNVNSPLNSHLLYCSGGSDDGYSSETSGVTQTNDQSLYCYGGNGDGFDQAIFNGFIYGESIFSFGGNGDGYDLGSFNGNIYGEPVFTYGGHGDGYSKDIYSGNIFGESVFTYGGHGDGYSKDIYSGKIFGESIFTYGGNGDGHSMTAGVSFNLGTGIWTGLTNTDWNTGTNWINNTIPNINHHVSIPSACPNYPIVGTTIGIDTIIGMIQCRELDILDGANFDHSDALYINGEMTVAGSYIGTILGINSHQLCKLGKLTIPATGIMIIGNQTAAPAMADMVIYDGGELLINGGSLQIDDKLWLQTGGSLLMTAGDLFVHKYGIGSPLLSQNPGFFYVEAGALGGISGGNFRICGNDNDGFQHIPPYSMVINEPGFDFTGTSTIFVQHGDDADHHNTSISVVDGVRFNNMLINKAFRSVFINGNLAIDGYLIVEENASLELNEGYTITIGP